MNLIIWMIVDWARTLSAPCAVSWLRCMRWRAAAGFAGVLWLCTGPALAAVTLTGIGETPSGGGSEAYGVSGDGSVVAIAEGFRWTNAGGFQSIGTMAGGTYANVRAVSVDGTTIVGWGDANAGTPDGLSGFRWTAAGMENLVGPLFGGFPVSASGLAVSGDGSVVVGGGGSQCPFPASQYNSGYRWSGGGGWQPVPPCSSDLHSDSTANGVSADGAVIVGYGGGRAFRWTAGGGTQDLGTLAPSLWRIPRPQR